MTKTFWITDNRFKFIALILFLMFIIFMTLIYLKAEELTNNPCTLCAKKMNQNVFCTIGGVEPMTRTYEPNGSIYDNKGFNNINYNLN